MFKVMILKVIGVTGFILGIGGLAGWAELERGFVPSVICLVVGILALYWEGEVKDEVRAWKKYESRRKKRR